MVLVTLRPNNIKIEYVPNYFGLVVTSANYWDPLLLSTSTFLLIRILVMYMCECDKVKSSMKITVTKGLLDLPN